MSNVKAMDAYAGKEGGARVGPVRLGCVGEAPGDFWEQDVAQVGSCFDVARIECVRLGADGEAQYINSLHALR